MASGQSLAPLGAALQVPKEIQDQMNIEKNEEFVKNKTTEIV
jgi:hypothetical protein